MVYSLRTWTPTEPGPEPGTTPYKFLTMLKVWFV